MTRQTTILTIAALAFSFLTSASLAGVSGKDYRTRLTAESGQEVDQCLEFTPTLNLIIFASGDFKADALEGVYWEVDLIVFGIFGCSVIEDGLLHSYNGTHLFGTSIFGSGVFRGIKTLAGSTVFRFEGREGCTPPDGAECCGK